MKIATTDNAVVRYNGLISPEELQTGLKQGRTTFTPKQYIREALDPHHDEPTGKLLEKILAAYTKEAQK